MNKKTICTAIGASLVATSGFARADNDTALLAPYVRKDVNVTTVVTVIGNGQPVSAGPTLHLQYWTKSTTDANTAACQPSSVTVPFTERDIMTFDTAGLLGYPLFGDTTNPAPLGTGISYAAPRHGYLVVQHLETQVDGSDDLLEAGYWIELDLANGGAHGDIAFGNAGGNAGQGPYDFDEALDNHFHLTNDAIGDVGSSVPVAFWPSSIVSTVFTVTPLGTNMLTRENNQMVLQVFNSDENDAVQGAYDRNENGVDGTVPITVRCVGRVTPAQLMPGVVTNAAWAAQGGWGYLVNLGDGDGNDGESQEGTNSGDVDAIVYQVDTSTASGKFMSNAINIRTYNNGDSF